MGLFRHPTSTETMQVSDSSSTRSASHVNNKEGCGGEDGYVLNFNAEVPII